MFLEEFRLEVLIGFLVHGKVSGLAFLEKVSKDLNLSLKGYDNSWTRTAADPKNQDRCFWMFCLQSV